MSTLLGGKSPLSDHGGKDGFVRVRKRDLDKLTTEVMQLREFLPRVLNVDLKEMQHKARRAEIKKEHLLLEHEHLRRDCAHLQSRLDAAQMDGHKEKEEKLLLREQLWRSGAELHQQADFCSSLGAAACSLLWSSSAKEETVTLWLADGKLQAFLDVTAQTLESFLKSLDEEVKGPADNSKEYQFVLGLVGTVTNIAAVTCGRDYLSNCGGFLLNTFVKLLEMMKPNAFPKLKVLLLMSLYNISISVQGLKYISENKGLDCIVWTFLEDGHWEVSLHCLRLLQCIYVESSILQLLAPSLMSPEFQTRVDQLCSCSHPILRVAAQQTSDDLKAIKPVE